MYLLAGQDPDTFFSSRNREVNNDASEPVNGEPLQYSYGRGTTYSIQGLYFTLQTNYILCWHDQLC